MYKGVRTIGLLSLTAGLAACESILVTESGGNHNVADFEAAWAWVDSVYPAFDIKRIDWASVYSEYRPRAETAQGDEFYQLLNDMLKLLADPHLYYSTPGGARFYPYTSPRLLNDRHLFSSKVVRTYFQSELHITGKDGVEYGILDGQIGYIHITHFNEDGMMDDFHEVMQFLRTTDGLIIDVRSNTGGDHDKVQVVVGMFIDSAMAWPLAVEQDGVPFEPWPDIQPVPGIPRYTNRVVVLINGASLSSGELFPEVMGQLPNVTLVGDTTAGAGCNDREESRGGLILPSGKQIHIPTGCLLRYDGIPWESIGIAPDIVVEQPLSDFSRGVDRQLEFAIEMMR